MSIKSKNIAVLGGGITGLCTAYEALRAGHSVSIYDPKGFPADNASAIAGGMLAPYSEIEHMNERWVEAGLSGIEFWRSFDGECGFQQNGSLLIAHEEDRYILERFRGHLPVCKQGLSAAREVESALPDKFEAGIYLEEEAHLQPRPAMQALVEAIKELGGEFYQEAVEPETVSADKIIDCRGMAAGDEDLRGVKGEIVLVRNPEFTLSRPVRLMHPRYPLYIVPRDQGVFMIGATQIESEGQGVSLRSAMELMSALYSLHPSFGEAEVLEILSGVRPTYSDNLPKIKACGNVLSINGLFRHGYLLGPVMAQVAVDMTLGKDNGYTDLFTGEKNARDHQRAGQKVRSAA